MDATTYVGEVAMIVFDGDSDCEYVHVVCMHDATEIRITVMILYYNAIHPFTRTYLRTYIRTYVIVTVTVICRVIHMYATDRSTGFRCGMIALRFAVNPNSFQRIMPCEPEYRFFRRVSRMTATATKF